MDFFFPQLYTFWINEYYIDLNNKNVHWYGIVILYQL